MSKLENFCNNLEDIREMYDFLGNKGIDELLGIIDIIKKKYDYGIISLDPQYYEDSGEIAYIDIIFEKCNHIQWKVLELEVLALENITKGKIAVLCLEGLLR